MTEPPDPSTDPAVDAGSQACAGTVACQGSSPSTGAPVDFETGSGRAAWRSASSAAGVLMSLAIHGAVLAAGLAWAKSDSGAIDQLSQAISIEMTMTSVEESADESPLQDTAASTESTAERVGISEEATRAEDVPAQELDAQPPPASEVAVIEPDAAPVPPPKGLEVIEGTLEGGEATGQASGQEDVKEPPKANKEKPPEEEKAKREAVNPTPDKTRPDAKDKQRTAALQQGGAKSKANSGSVASSGRVSASTGNLLSYKQRVNSRVAGNKPGGSGARGTATVSFGVSSSGSLSYARLSRSSGSPAADAAAVAAVRRAGPFGPTPTGGPLSFSFSFYFR